MEHIVTAEQHGYTYTVDFDGEQFWTSLMTFDQTGGVAWELEMGAHPTRLAAVNAAVAWIRDTHAADVAYWDWIEFETEHFDVIRKLRAMGRMKHPTDLAIPTGLTVDELDEVVDPATSETPQRTVRDVLHDEARQLVVERLATFRREEMVNSDR